MREYPILFNTEMVRALLDGRKTATRRLVKPQPPKTAKLSMGRTFACQPEITYAFDEALEHPAPDDRRVYKAPYSVGDILYVRETWSKYKNTYTYRADTRQRGSAAYYLEHKAGSEFAGGARWHPSIHMPKAAARIWLKVTDVRIEQLRDITDKGARAEGCGDPDVIYCNGALKCEFAELWQRTIKPKDLSKYGYLCNPWVWVIEFERCEKPEECHEAAI